MRIIQGRNIPKPPPSINVVNYVSQSARAIALSVISLFLFTAFSFQSIAQTTQTYTTPGTYTFTVPAGVSQITVEAWGAGGGGGGNNSNKDGAGGGGGGGYSRCILSVVAGNTYTVNVGHGGIGGTGAQNGNAGESSWFGSSSTVLANGGDGGQQVTSKGGTGGTGGAVGIVTGTSTVTYFGGNGAAGRDNNYGIGGGSGSSAGTGANGSNASNDISTYDWIGATAPTGGGDGANGGWASDGSDGTSPGGGGSGAGEGSNRSGGNGANGQVQITYTVTFPSFWYKADAGTSTTTNNAGVISWTDQSASANDASSQLTAPTYSTSGWNFNPRIIFSSGYFLTSGNTITDDMTFFVVYSSTQTTGSSNFWETPALIGGETSGSQNDFTLSTNSGKLYFKGTTGDNFGAQTTGTYNNGKAQIVSVTRQKSSTGNIYLFVNGSQAASATSDNISLSDPTKLGIGNHFSYQASAQYEGGISEVFGTNSVYSATARQGFEAYLAIKYGITLGTTASPITYINSAGTTIWTGNTTYQNDVHGIGRDDAYGLNQLSSKSENPGTDILVIQSGTSFTVPTNAQTGTALTDKQFFISGHNNGSTTTVSALSTGINTIARKWYAQATNSLPTESFQFNLSGTSFGTYCKIGVLIADDAALTTNPRFVEGTLSSSTLTVNNLAVTGNKYFTVATLATPSTGAIAANQTICNGSTPSTLTSTTAGTGFGTISYLWESSTDGSTWNTISGATNSTYSPGALTQTTYYRRKTVATLGSVTCTSAATSSVLITVRPVFTAGAISTTGETICNGGTPSQIGSTTLASGGDGTITYSWRSSADGYASAISGATSSTYTPPAGLTTTTSYMRYANDGTCNTTPTASTGTWTVTVWPQFTAGAIETTGETICSGGDPGLIGSSSAASGGDGTITYKWQANGVDIASSNSATYDPPAGLTATSVYTRWAKDNSCNTTFIQSTGSWTVTIRPVFTAGAIESTGETICYGTVPATQIGSTVAASGGDNSITYQWQYSTDNTFATGVTTVSNNSDTYTPTQTLMQTTYYRRQAKDGTCNNTFTSSINNWTVTVNPAPTTPTASSNSPVCDGSTLQLSTAAISGASYLWTGPGGFSSTLREPTVIANYYSNQGTYSVTVSLNGCTSEAGTTDVVIDPASVGGNIDYVAPVCEGSSVTLNLNGNTGNVVRWERRLGTSGTWITITGTSTKLTDTPPSGGSWEYRAVVQSGTCSEAYSATQTVFVNPTLTIALGSDPEVCQNITTASWSYSATTGSPDGWNLVFDAAAVFAGFTSPQTGSLNPAPGTILVNVPYSVAVGTYNANLTVTTSYPVCTSTNYPVTITVDVGSPVSVSISGDNTVCSGTDVTYTATPTNGGTSPVYQWKVNGSNVGSNSATYSYTPVNGDKITCELTSNATCATGSPATSNEITMAVNPLPTSPAINAPTLACTGDDVVFTITGNAGDQVTYTGATGSPASPVTIGSGGTVDVTVSNVTSDVTLNLTGVDNGTCSKPLTGVSATVTVTTNNTITLTSASGTDNQTVNIETAITTITYTTTGASGATFSGLPNGVLGSWAANVVTINGTPTQVGTFSYTITLTGGCGIVTTTGTIKVSNTFDVWIEQPAPTCNAADGVINTSGIDTTTAITFVIKMTSGNTSWNPNWEITFTLTPDNSTNPAAVPSYNAVAANSGNLSGTGGTYTLTNIPSSGGNATVLVSMNVVGNRYNTLTMDFEITEAKTTGNNIPDIDSDDWAATQIINAIPDTGNIITN